MTSRPTVSLAAGTTRVAFARQGDRWAHRLVVAGADGLAEWESVEDDAAADARWPASPPLTEVAVVDAGGRPAILGVGRAGRSHFSLSMTSHPALPDTLLVEVACRLHEPPGWLGSTYRSPRVGARVRIEPAADAAADLPRTVAWAYTLGPRGVVAGRGDEPSPPG